VCVCVCNLMFFFLFVEQETQCLATHGASKILQSRLRDQSDAFEICYCTKCQLQCISAPDLHIYHCTSCDSDDFLVRTCIPFSLWLLINELKAAGITLDLNFE